MNRSVTIINNCGQQKSVAIVISTSSNNGGFPLVWASYAINSGVKHTFSCDDTPYKLGWGTTSAPLNHGVLYTDQQANAVDPRVNNAVLLSNTSSNASFNLDASSAYHDGSLDGISALMIKTDGSFTSSQSEETAVALYINTLPAIAMQTAPNTRFFFDVQGLNYYMLVTDAQPGVALSQMMLGGRDKVAQLISIGSPTLIPFVLGPQQQELNYELTERLEFLPLSNT